MRTTFLLITFSLAFCFVSPAQSSDPDMRHFRKNDILIDPITLISGPIFNASYERIVNSDIGVGVHTLLGLGAMDEMIQFSPYTRMYFGAKYASGFFLEGFVPITSTKEAKTVYNEATGNYIEQENQRNTTVGLGVGIGGKWLLKRNIVLELGGGIGRRFFHQGHDSEPITGKWMVGLGFKF